MLSNTQCSPNLIFLTEKKIGMIKMIRKFCGFLTSSFTTADAISLLSAFVGNWGEYDFGGPTGGAPALSSLLEILLVALDLDLDRGRGSPSASMATGLY